jgi:DnaJ homolog subfamily B member 4
MGKHIFRWIHESHFLNEETAPLLPVRIIPIHEISGHDAFTSLAIFFSAYLCFFINILVLNSHTGTESEILTIDIKSGWKKGTKITFPDKGNEQPNQPPADLVFVIDEKPHELYTREGNDLLVHRKIGLVDALAGTTVNLKTLDGRDLVIKLADVVTPGYELVIAKEGMPIVKENGRRGNLRIKFDVDFPKRLSSEQRHIIRKVLGGQSQQQ